MNKKEVREKIKERLLKLDGEEKEILDKQIFKNFNLKFSLSGNVFIYKSTTLEVETKYIINKYLDTVNLYFPVIENDNMFLVKVNKNTIFERGFFNILEPQGERILPTSIKIDYCITPLLGYDKSLNRLGKGKGFYDRYFASCDCLKIGLAYKCQEVDKLQVEDNDIKLNFIVNEEEIISESNIWKI